MDPETNGAQLAPDMAHAVSNGSADSFDVAMNDVGAVETGADPSAAPTTNGSSILDTKEAYLKLVEQRRARCYAEHKAVMSKCRVVSNYTLNQSTAVNCLALSSCGTHLYTGGQDGFVRRYGLTASLNGHPEEQGVNLTMRQTTNERLPVLLGYWENEETGSWNDDNTSLVASSKDPSLGPATLPASKWGPKIQAYSSSSLPSPVYSVAVQSQELWGLSGTQRGSINLFTIRHDEGHIRHVFRPVSPAAAPSSGHKPTAISVLKLEPSETSFLSGGWDGRIIQWDLNTGSISRCFNAHKSQISSIEHRPVFASDMATNPPVKAEETQDDDDDVDADGEMDEDADGDVDPEHVASAAVADIETFAQGTTLSDDILLTSSIEGTMFLWDRRVPGFARKIPLAESVATSAPHAKSRSHWCPHVAWHPSGQAIAVPTRNSALVYDLRSASYTTRLAPPAGSGIVSHVRWISESQCLVASEDCIRIFDAGLSFDNDNLAATTTPPTLSTVKGIIVPGPGGSISSMVTDARRKILVAASGSRGWEGSSSETVVVYDVVIR